MQRNTIWTVPILLFALLCPVFADEPKGVTVSLRVKWPGTSVLLEAAEFLVGLWPVMNSMVISHKHTMHLTTVVRASFFCTSAGKRELKCLLEFHRDLAGTQ